MVEYILLLQRAWQILTRHKLLWLFALLAVICGQDALFNLRGATRLQPFGEAIVNLPLTVAAALRSALANDSALLLGLAMIAAGLILTIAGVLFSAALIGLTQAIERGQDVSFKIGWRLALKRFVPMVGLRLIFNLPATLLSFLGLVVVIRLINPPSPPVFYQQTLQVLQESGWLGILLLIGLAIGVLIGAIGIGADRACVLEGVGVIESLQRGWEVLNRNRVQYLIITGIFISSTLLIVLLLACPTALLLTDQFSGFIQSAPIGSDLISTLIVHPLGIALLIVGLILYAGVTAYTSIVWTLAYRRHS
jgi:hypothetical protein